MTQIFITGTDTDIGKTFITLGLSLVSHSLNHTTCVFKPIQSGAILDENSNLKAPDLELISQYDKSIKTHCSYLLKTPCAPQIASEVENVQIDLNRILSEFKSLESSYENLIVEGAGGLLVPLSSNILLCDLIKMLNIPTILVCRPNLGTVNHVLLAINELKRLNIKLKGVIINRYPQNTNDIAITTAPRLIEEHSDAKVIGIINNIDFSKGVSVSDIIAMFMNSVDLKEIFGKNFLP